MVTYIVRRVTTAVVLLALILSIAYILLFFGSGDIARRILGPSATDEAVAERAAELGLDRPVLEQFASWLTAALQGDLGYSWFTGQQVVDSLSGRVPVTLSLVTGAVVVTALVAVVLGVLAASRGGVVDRVTQVVSLIGFAVPGFIIAVVLVLVFALGLGLFSPTGYIPFSQSPAGWVSTVTLPVVALAMSGVAAVAQQVRGSTIDALRHDYVRTLRSRGIPEGRVVYLHILRNSAGPALAVLALQFVGLLGGAVIVEQIFAIPGIGPAAVAATIQGDIPLVMGIVTATATIVIVFNLLIELLQGWLNPKVRIS